MVNEAQCSFIALYKVKILATWSKFKNKSKMLLEHLSTKSVPYKCTTSKKYLCFTSLNWLQILCVSLCYLYSILSSLSFCLSLCLLVYR